MSAEAWGVWAGLVVTLGIAIVGWARANKAGTHADQALELAQSAEARADRLERIALERRDVSWVRVEVTGDRGVLSFKNTGTDTAHDVTLVVDPQEGPRREVPANAVGPAERIGIQMPDLATEAHERFMNAPPGMLLSPGFAVRARLTWRSESGVPGIQDWDEIAV